MGQITIDQSHQVMATLAVNTNWDEVDFEKSGLQDLVVRNPKEAGRRFTAILKQALRMMIGIFPIFKTIKVGTGPKNPDEFRMALKDAGCQISDWANDLLDKPEFTVASQEADVDLVGLTTAQLTGNANGGTTTEVFAGAAKLGLGNCAPDDGPQLRRQYLDQPLGEWLHMGMNPIRDSSGDLDVFHVGHIDDGLWLNARCAGPDNHWDGVILWVFRRRK